MKKFCPLCISLSLFLQQGHCLYSLLLLDALFLLPSSFPPLMATRHHALGFQISKKMFTHHFNQPTTCEINDHGDGQSELELQDGSARKSGQRQNFTHRILHFYNLQPPIQLRYKVSCTGECNSTCCYEAPPQRGILPYSFAEWPPLTTRNSG